MIKEKKYEEFLSPLIRKSRRHFPIIVKKANSLFLEDENGKKYIDFTSGMGSVIIGHRHPEVIQGITKQLDKLIHICPHVGLYEPYLELSKQISLLLPGNLGYPFFTNSGTEANEAAIRLATWYTNRQYIISFIGSFHGMTSGSFTMTSIKSKYRARQVPTISNVIGIPFPYCYRCIVNSEFPRCNLACLNYLKLIFRSFVPPENIAAIIVEPIQGDGGVIVPPKRFFREIKSLCKENGILLIFDEAQTGFGRTGKMFASEKFEVIPDIITLGKGIANGMPLGAMACDKHILDKLNYFPYGSTFGGNPLSLVASLATLRVINKEKILQNVNKVGGYMKKRLKEVKEKNECIGDVRGKGLMLGVEIVKNRQSKDPWNKCAEELKNLFMKKGLLIPVGGIFSNVFRFLPPLILDIDTADMALDTISNSIKNIGEK
jgi:4-aminobutyrate aminotransferase